MQIHCQGHGGPPGGGGREIVEANPDDPFREEQRGRVAARAGLRQPTQRPQRQHTAIVVLLDRCGRSGKKPASRPRWTERLIVYRWPRQRYSRVESVCVADMGRIAVGCVLARIGIDARFVRASTHPTLISIQRRRGIGPADYGSVGRHHENLHAAILLPIGVGQIGAPPADARQIRPRPAADRPAPDAAIGWPRPVPERCSSRSCW